MTRSRTFSARHRGSSPRAWPHVASAGLPESDDTIEELTAAEREAVGASWSSRAANELATAQTFGMLSTMLVPRGVDPEVTWLAARAVADEVRHAEICRTVAAAYLAKPVEWPQARTLEAPRFGSTSPELGTTLFIVLQCCMNETIAGAYLRACQNDARGPLVRAALRELLRDEIDHARLGWAHLASPHLSKTARRHVAAAIPNLLQSCRSLWLDEKRTERPTPSGHGCVPNAALPRIVDDAIEELVLPGLRHVGVV